MSVADPPWLVTANAMETTGSLPPCPITGRPARRRIQKVPAKLLRSLWQRGLGIDVDRLFHGVEPPGLYESACGLVFFHPAIQGDQTFYSDFYRRIGMHEFLNTDTMQRTEYRHAARYVKPEATVLDVGCGQGGFRHHLPQVRYCGLDPFAPADAGQDVLREGLESHAGRFPEYYDVVTAFQVIEHVAEPNRLVASMARALRPGGHLILCAPLHPSPMTAIPNFLLNAPPHHLTWWNTPAFAALARAQGLDLLESTPLAPSPHEGMIHWMNRLSPCKTGPVGNERYFAHRWSWHLSLGWSFGIARGIFPLWRLPSDARPINMLLAARKPD